MRSISAAALRSMFEETTDEAWLILITIDHDDIDDPIRGVNNYEAITSRGNVYIPFPFEIEFPSQEAESAGEARLRIDNVDREIVRTLRQIDTPPSVTIEVIVASQPNTVEASFEGLILRNAEYDAQSVTGTLRFEDIVAEPITVQMTPQRFPGMF